MSFKFRKKPVIIEAFQYHKGKFQGYEAVAMPQWLIMALANGTLFAQREAREKLMVQTVEGSLEVSDGDFIIQGVKGELYPCKPDIFALTYDKVE